MSYEKIRSQPNTAKKRQKDIQHLGFEESFRYSDEIKKITRSQVIQVAKKYINFSQSVLSIAGPIDKKARYD